MPGYTTGADVAGIARNLALLAAASSDKLNTPATANPFVLDFGGMPFNTGLMVTSTGTWDATIVYE